MSGTGADYIVTALVQAGVKRVYGVVHVLPLLGRDARGQVCRLFQLNQVCISISITNS